ncbi:MAG: hypothetical protein DHS80DRAFT_25453 [Piptocephalis tieghemiana]|nr:MAG: hypothetical protein DHS80DRAFT_25453 [Piptocephalis tieghemiana]
MDRRAKLEALAEKRRKHRVEEEGKDLKQPSSLAQKDNATQSPARTKSKSLGISRVKPSSPSTQKSRPAPTIPKPRPARVVREDQYDVDDGFVVESDEEEEEEEGQAESSVSDSEEEEDLPRRSSGKKRKVISSKEIPKRTKKAKSSGSRKHDSDDEIDQSDSDDDDDALEGLDTSNIIQDSGRGGRRTTRGRTIDYKQFGPDKDEDEE